MAKKMGRPTIEIDQELFEKMCQFMCTEEDIANYFDCSTDTIYNWCKKTYGGSFSEVYKKESVKGKMSLRNSMYKNAITNQNVTMQIFLAKNQLGMSDKQELKLETEKPITIKVEVVHADK